MLCQTTKYQQRQTLHTAREWGRRIPVQDRVCLTTYRPEESNRDRLVFRWPDSHEATSCRVFLVSGLGLMAAGATLGLCHTDALLALLLVPLGLLITAFSAACLAYRNDTILDCRHQCVTQRAGLFRIHESVLPLSDFTSVGLAWVPAGPRSPAEYHVCLVGATSGLPLVWLAGYCHRPGKALALCRQIAARTGLANVAPVGAYD